MGKKSNLGKTAVKKFLCRLLAMPAFNQHVHTSMESKTKFETPRLKSLPWRSMSWEGKSPVRRTKSRSGCSSATRLSMSPKVQGGTPQRYPPQKPASSSSEGASAEAVELVQHWNSGQEEPQEPTV